MINTNHIATPRGKERDFGERGGSGQKRSKTDCGVDGEAGPHLPALADVVPQLRDGVHHEPPEADHRLVLALSPPQAIDLPGVGGTGTLGNRRYPSAIDRGHGCTNHSLKITQSGGSPEST